MVKCAQLPSSGLFTFDSLNEPVRAASKFASQFQQAFQLCGLTPKPTMKALQHLVLTPLAAVLLSSTVVSCASGPNAQTGTVIGGLGGAALGGIIGHQSGRGLEGAAIGGALGALGGNWIGDAQDQRNYYYARSYAPRQYYAPRAYYAPRTYYAPRPYYGY
jgi:hypothetical protein